MLQLGALFVVLAGSELTVLDNDYATVVKNGAPCAEAGRPECGDRVLVALSEVKLGDKTLSRGDTVLHLKGKTYQPPMEGD